MGHFAHTNSYKNQQPVDDIYKINLSDGTRTYWHKTGTADTFFYDQTQPEVSRDGSRILHNTNCYWINGDPAFGTSGPGCIAPVDNNDVQILYTGEESPPPPPPPGPSNLIIGGAMEGTLLK